MESRKTHKRSDIARGLIRSEGTFIEESTHTAPLFCIACELADKTALPQLVQKAIWAIANAVSCVEKGEEGAYIRGIPGLKCIIKKKGSKSCILHVCDNGGETVVLKEVEMEIRIHEAKATLASGEVIIEHYIFFIALSPLAFSIRKAIHTTLQLKSRGMDATYSDARRHTWNLLATHVRQGLSRDAQSMRYTSREVANAHDTSGADWIQISSSMSFTRLFSVITSMDWVRNHFFSKHEGVDLMTLEGFGDFERDFECTEPSHISGCIRYDEDVNKALAATALWAKKRGGGNKKRRRAGEEEEDNDNSEGDMDEEEAEEEVTISVPTGFVSELDGHRRGFPACKIAMKVMVPLVLETPVSLFQFMPQVHAFPASVILDILKKTLEIEQHDGDAIVDDDDNNNNEGDEEEEEQLLTLFESQGIVCGGDTTLKRPMLSNGDASWAIKCEKNVMSLRGNSEAKRVSHLRSFIRLGFGLALTRAMGSDIYVNGRVAAYGKFIEHSSGSLSKQECAATCEKIDQGCRMGCGMHEALMLLERTLTLCNSASWNLRPDNLFLVLQMMVSDVMLCLNYHGSVIGGACNGIGATLVVRDGGGNYRRWFKDPSSAETGSTLGQVYSKRNGSGADFGVSVYKSVCGIGVYYDRFKLDKEIISELKRTTELGLMQEACNIVEGVGSEMVQTHSVTETMNRKYSTELKAGNDSQSQSCMQAIAWLVPRNTTSTDVNIFKSTRENEKTKSRISVEYRQVIYGYWLICSNSVGNLSRERFRTLVTVSRSIPSAGNALSPSTTTTNNNSGRGNGVQDASSMVKDSYDPQVIAHAKPIFFSSLCTAVVTGFMQWTGILGKLPSSPGLEAMIGVFYAQLDLSKDILNPDMFNQGERPRCLQISKARGVASSLIASAIHETIEAGRLGKSHQDAIESCSLRLMTESTSVSIAPWIMADTMDHMLRLDFFILMQILCHKLAVPDNVDLESVLGWLETGEVEDCGGELQEWMSQCQLMDRTTLDKRMGLTPVESCMYITHPNLSCCIPDPAQTVVDATVCDFMGMLLFKQYSEKLAQECQIHENLSGAEVLKAMLTCCTNQQFTWPSVFGDIHRLPKFWMNREPAQNADSLTLCPIRIVTVEAHRAALWVDVRWLLLTAALCGNSPSQSSRHLVVGRWIQHFFKYCIPDRMVCSKELFLGIPSPVMHGGFVCPPTVASNRRLLRRPATSSSNAAPALLGTEAPIASSMVEDLGPAAPRYQLATVLKVCERTLPVNCGVRYSLPHRLWTPVRFEADGTFGSIKTDNDGVFWLTSRDHAEPQNITHVSSDGDDDDNGEESYLDGRVNVNLRPLCVFDRPGVLLECPPHYDEPRRPTTAGVVLQYDIRGAYRVLLSNGQEVEMDPYQVEDSVLKLHTVVHVSMAAFSDEWKEHATFYANPKKRDELQMRGSATNASNVLQCMLSIPTDEHMAEGTVRVSYEQHTDIGKTSVAFFGSSKIGSNVSAYTTAQYADVHVSHIRLLRPSSSDDDNNDGSRVLIFKSVYLMRR